MGIRIKPGGVGQYFDPGASFACVEVHTSTCSHCQRIAEFPSMRRMHEFVDVCRGCMKLICLECAGKPCVTWLKKCDIDEAIYRRNMLAGA